MSVRVYILAADSERPLAPTFKRLPGGRVNASLEILDLDVFANLTVPEIEGMAADLAGCLGVPAPRMDYERKERDR